MTILTERFQRALIHAATAHACQRRKGTPIPYISHLLAVASLVLENGGTEDEAIAALLHDAVEDQGGAVRYELIKAEFGEPVANVVKECSDADRTPKPEWRQRKEEYVAKIPAKSASAQLVSLADKVHNARCILTDYTVEGEDLWKRFRGGREGTLWYYRSLLDAYRELPDRGLAEGPLARELGRVVEELERLTSRPSARAPKE